MIIGIHKDRDKPHWADYVLATAFETLEAEKCGKCGVPVWYGFSEDNRVAFDIQHSDCMACAHKETEDKKNKDEVPGRTSYVVAKPEEGFELPTRKDFQDDMLAKALKEAVKAEAVVG